MAQQLDPTGATLQQANRKNLCRLDQRFIKRHPLEMGETEINQVSYRRHGQQASQRLDSEPGSERAVVLVSARTEETSRVDRSGRAL